MLSLQILCFVPQVQTSYFVSKVPYGRSSILITFNLFLFLYRFCPLISVGHEFYLVLFTFEFFLVFYVSVTVYFLFVCLFVFPPCVLKAVEWKTGAGTWQARESDHMWEWSDLLWHTHTHTQFMPSARLFQYPWSCVQATMQFNCQCGKWI